MYSDLLTVVCTPREFVSLEPRFHAAVFSHSISPDGELMRYNIAADTRGCIAVVSVPAGTAGFSSLLTGCLSSELNRSGASGLFFDLDKETDGTDTLLKELGSLLSGRRLPLYIPPLSHAPENAVIVESAAVTAGSYRARLEELTAKHRGRLAIDIEPLRVDYSLPSPGSGENISAEKLAELLDESPLTYFSNDLYARYFTYHRGETTHFVVYDDEGSIAEKLKLAESMGVRAAFAPYASIKNMLDGVAAFS